MCFNVFVGGFIPLLLFPDRNDITDVLLKIALKHHNPLYLTLNVCADILSNNVGLVHVNIYASTDTVTVLLKQYGWQSLKWTQTNISPSYPW